jgi:ERCC4-type nuclease
MIMLVDTREQDRLEFSHSYVEDSKVIKLDVGDYQVQYRDGYIPPVAFERKSIGDLYGTMTHGYARFKRELERAREGNIKLILIIEGTYTKIAGGYDRSEFQGESMVRKLMTMWIKYELVPVFCKDRVEMANYIAEYYCAIGRLKGNRCANA